jgi:hypothetical protein
MARVLTFEEGLQLSLRLRAPTPNNGVAPAKESMIGGKCDDDNDEEKSPRTRVCWGACVWERWQFLACGSACVVAAIITGFAAVSFVAALRL